MSKEAAAEHILFSIFSGHFPQTNKRLVFIELYRTPGTENMAMSPGSACRPVSWLRTKLKCHVLKTEDGTVDLLEE